MWVQGSPELGIANAQALGLPAKLLAYEYHDLPVLDAKVAENCELLRGDLLPGKSKIW